MMVMKRPSDKVHKETVLQKCVCLFRFQDNKIMFL